MLWGRSSEPSKHKALSNARYAFEGYINGTERAYMVNAALDDLQDAYGIEIKASTLAKEALKTEDEGERLRLTSEALSEVLKALKPYDCRSAKQPAFYTRV